MSTAGLSTQHCSCVHLVVGTRSGGVLRGGASGLPSPPHWAPGQGPVFMHIALHASGQELFVALSLCFCRSRLVRQCTLSPAHVLLLSAAAPLEAHCGECQQCADAAMTMMTE